jgi:tetratricopeptide (TPR) repeat protein
MPPAEMKGDFSPWQYFKMPDEAEQQKMVDDCNKFLRQFGEETDKLCEKTDVFEKQVYSDDEDEDNKSQSDKMLEEAEKMHNEIYDNTGKYSIEPVSLYKDFEEFRGAWSEESTKTMEAWDDFIVHENVFIEVYNAFIDTMNARAEKNDEGEEGADENADDIPGNEIDDIRAETIQRYESGTATYFDVDDWHIILDSYEQKYDHKNKGIALEKAFEQHPQNATLMLRKAQDEMGKHEYQKALDLIKQAEAQGPPHHPNLFFIKADVYLQMHAPELAIPLYNKLIAAKGEGAEQVRHRAWLKLADVYASQEKYTECIELCKEILKLYPEDENIVANLSKCYLSIGMVKEAEETVETYLKKFPESTVCMEQLGYVCIEKKDYYNAAKQFQDCYDINPLENYNLLSDKGDVMMELKHFNSAVVCFETCLFHYHLEKDYHMKAAACYTELKMPYAARFHYHKAIEIDPNCVEAAQRIEQSRLNN